ncbi:group II intron reverse transcriptase/maturase [Clostridium beijerinckii]|uniref:Group II intron reverse transcriptase/maturase n=1 Tax=Clostridium beijerinckii TaxID=1520 RepID=A0AAE5H990_CLOBE|nr:group II intron reverse transcriptase/maturase [Clostridium beijerinckii]NSB17011.1 group II intron reverse transcriptase/maturase [Clostridium beijerinckii]OOM26790.1 group II intron-encoded protein LtrA [Clostridium beijerinckii]
MINELLGIQFNIEKARLDGKVQNLASYINKETLIASHKQMDKKKARGIDNISKEDYSKKLEENVANLVERMKNGSYKPNATRRTYIPKDGSNKMRPLGISCYEDKLIENIIAQILTMIYEPKFYDDSFGFRPNRNCHQAVRQLVENVQYHKVCYIVEADIKGFFDNVNHEWMIKFLGHDIADKRFIEIINKFLKAGIMEDGKYIDSEKGTPQGNGASPVLANVYLHYVLDNWFDVMVKRKYRGETYLVRYCDDFVCCFQHKWEAEKFYKELIERFNKFGLELALEKTKILEFGKFAKENRERRGLGKPETFDFLGFTFYCSENSNKSYFRCKVKTSKKKYRSKVKAMKQWIKLNRNMPISELIKKINQKLRGHYQYYGVTDNTRSVKSFLNTTRYLLFKWINRRSQKRSYTLESFYNGLLRTLPLLEPKISVSLFYR